MMAIVVLLTQSTPEKLCRTLSKMFMGFMEDKIPKTKYPEGWGTIVLEEDGDQGNSGTF